MHRRNPNPETRGTTDQMSAEINTVGSASHAPDPVRKFAEKLAKVQGCKVTLSNEARGYHIYIPCPECLHTHGKRELADPKYAINVSKALGLGDAYKGPKGDGFMPTTAQGMQDMMDHDREMDSKSSVCMRTRQSKEPHRFSISELMTMTTISERHPDIQTRAEVVGQAGSADRESHWEADPESGVLCPPPPGIVVPITSLPPDHPAVRYLTDRGYDLQRLWQQFRCSFCVEEYPEGKNDVFYRKMPAGWKDTPQHRIIFHSLHKGAPLTWQGRYPEKLDTEGLNKFMLHPYVAALANRTRDLQVSCSDGSRFVWSHVATRPSHNAAWIPVPPFDEQTETGTLKFQPSKYRTAKYSTRQMMGWDAALARADADSDPLRWCVLCEGPLDAARVGPGGIALIGSSISPENAEKVASAFHVVFTAFDEDRAGKEATDRIGKMILGAKQRAPLVQMVVPLQIASGKDIGDMSQEAFDALLQKTLKRVKRGL